MVDLEFMSKATVGNHWKTVNNNEKNYIQKKTF